MKMKLLAKFGFVILATGASLGVGSPVDAGQPDWVKSERVQFLKAVRIEPLRSRLHKGIQMPAVKIEQENAVQDSQQRNANERWLNIYKSLSFLGGA